MSIFEISMIATFKRYCLNFKQPSGTSRGVLKTKDTWILTIAKDDKIGVGECGMFKGLSCDDRPDYEDKLQWTCDNINLGLDQLLHELQEFPSIQFGLEIAFKSLEQKSPYILFPSEFTESKKAIPINGLIWMGSEAFMKQQIADKLKQGFTCIKMKIGAIDFKTEMSLLKSIRKEFTSKDIELRVDANGAFAPNEALEKLKRLSDYNLHSIEQPIQRGQVQEMTRLCANTSLPIALDEELIGVFSASEKKALIDTIKPQYIILKPSLVGGFSGTKEWISIAEKNNSAWWITSALESNVGLNAISQFTYTLKSRLPQGLGTGSLFTNNIQSPLEVNQGALHYNNLVNWDFKL